MNNIGCVLISINLINSDRFQSIISKNMNSFRIEICLTQKRILIFIINCNDSYKFHFNRIVNLFEIFNSYSRSCDVDSIRLTEIRVTNKFSYIDHLFFLPSLVLTKYEIEFLNSPVSIKGRGFVAPFLLFLS